jgi:hypothetical protein
MNTQQPTIALLVMTNGRDGYLSQTIASARENLSGNIVERWIHDDAGDLAHGAMLDELYPDFVQIPRVPTARAGFGGSIRFAWERLARSSRADFVFHLEDDFTFNRPVDLDAMAALLVSEPLLAQVALRRQAWNEGERAAGGVVEQHPHAYTDRGAMVVTDSSLVTRVEWLEHMLFFTTNPCLYPRRTMHDGLPLWTWPRGSNSEGHYSIRLREAGYRFAFWGSRHDKPWVHHIGVERTGNGY